MITGRMLLFHKIAPGAYHTPLVYLAIMILNIYFHALGIDPRLPCPDTHPVKIPQIRIFTRIEPYSGGIHVFSDGTGYFHSDYFSGWEASFLQGVLDNCVNPSFEAMPTQWCNTHVTFRDEPKNPNSNHTNIALLQTLQPNPPFDPSSITTEQVDNVACLPGNSRKRGVIGIYIKS